MIEQLPCFSGSKLEVTSLNTGFSHQCFKVESEQGIYFVKALNAETSLAEVNSSLFCSNRNLKSYFPDVIYHDDDWLVTRFVYGIVFSHSSLSTSQKESYALDLIRTLHQLDLSSSSELPPRLTIHEPVSSLLGLPHQFNANQLNTINLITDLLNDTYQEYLNSSPCPFVLCHGDVNYSNIILSEVGKPLLVDFECARVAPREFDIAMFIAINHIPPEDVPGISAKYAKLCECVINSQLLNHFILYSHLLNALWYNITSFNKDNDPLLIELAYEQIKAFDELSCSLTFAHKKTSNLLPELAVLIGNNLHK